MNENLIAQIKKRSTQNDVFVIAVSGFGGSGKSTFARQLAKQLEKVAIVSVDDFVLKRLEGRSSDWNSFDWVRFEKEIFIPLYLGVRKITYGVYDWDKNKVDETKEITLPHFTIIEGVGLLRKEFMRYFDYSIWITCPLKVASERGIKRDNEEYHVDHTREWKEIWTPNDEDYFAKHRPDTLANTTTTFQK